MITPRRVAWLLAAAVIAAIHLTTVSDEFGGNFGGDNAGYFMLAKALASGRGFTDIYLPNEPANTHYPFLFPLLLAPFEVLFAQPLLPMHIMVALFGAGAALLTGRFVRQRTGSDLTGLLIAFGVAILPRYYLQSGHLLSEPVYTFFCMLALNLTPDRDAPISRARLAGLIAASLAAYFTRTAGVALLAAVLLGLNKRRPLAAGAAAAVFVAAAGAWWLRNSFAGGEGSAYLSQLLAGDPTQVQPAPATAATVWARLRENLGYYAPLLGSTLACPLPRISGTARLIAAGIGCGLTALGLAAEVRRGERAAPGFMLGSVAILALWPFTEDRFLLPVLPLALFYAWRGLELVLKLAPVRRVRPALTAALIVIWFAATGYYTARAIGSRFVDGRMPRAPVPVAGRVVIGEPVVNWAKYDVNFSDPRLRDDLFINQMTAVLILNRAAAELVPPGKVIMSRLPVFTYLWTGRKSVRSPYAEPEEFWRCLTDNRVDYLISFDPGDDAERCRQSRPDRFRLVAEVPLYRARLYEVIR